MLSDREEKFTVSMSKVEKRKVSKNLKGMVNASVQCGDLLKYIQNEVPLTEEMKQAFVNVIQHNQNMIAFLNVLEQQLQKE